MFLTVLCLFSAHFAIAKNVLTNSFERDEVAFARKGTLGRDSYVVTNVYPQLPAYQLVTSSSTVLVDRAINRYTPSGDTIFTLPRAPLVRANDRYRSARAFILVVTVTNPSPPKISFPGAVRLVSAFGGESLALDEGENALSFVEIDENVYVVDTFQLTTIKQ